MLADLTVSEAVFLFFFFDPVMLFNCSFVSLALLPVLLAKPAQLI